MTYADFTLSVLKEQFGLQTDEQGDYFAATQPPPVSERLRQRLAEYVPLAFAIATDKARAELVITPILLEVMKQYDNPTSYFSGSEFNVDPELNLCGSCDFLFGLSPEQLTIEMPVLAIVEAKNEDFRRGINQCVAEMVAAQRFNQARGGPVETVYGAVTTGTSWLFLRLSGTRVSIDRTEYHICQVEKIVGILVRMLREAGVQVGYEAI